MADDLELAESMEQRAATLEADAAVLRRAAVILRATPSGVVVNGKGYAQVGIPAVVAGAAAVAGVIPGAAPVVAGVAAAGAVAARRRSRQGSVSRQLLDLLRADATRTWTAQEAFDALTERGYESERSTDPVNGIRTALARLAEREQIERRDVGEYSALREPTQMANGVKTYPNESSMLAAAVSGAERLREAFPGAVAEREDVEEPF